MVTYLRVNQKSWTSQCSGYPFGGRQPGWHERLPLVPDFTGSLPFLGMVSEVTDANLKLRVAVVGPVIAVFGSRRGTARTMAASTAGHAKLKAISRATNAADDEQKYTDAQQQIEDLKAK